jgi:methionyl aminopeptidase
MAILKSAEEIEIMRQAGKIVAECHAMIEEKIKPGVTTSSLDRLVEEHIRGSGAKPSFKGHHGFPASICVALNDVICHGFPSDRQLEDGDVVTIDVGAFYQGLHGDSAWTYPVGTVSSEIEDLMATCKEALFLGIAQAVPQNHIGDIGYAIQTFSEQHNYGVVRDFTGHGVGRDLWEKPPVFHYGYPGTGPVIKKGMTLAIEPMLTLGDWRCRLDADGWTARTIDGSICVQYEHTIAVTDGEPEILTTL